MLCVFLLQATPTATPPFCQLAWPVDQLTNLSTKSGASLWIHLEVMCHYAIGHSHCHAPFKLIDMSTNTHLYTHTLDLQAKLQCSKAKTVTVIKWGIFMDRPTERPVKLLVADKKQRLLTRSVHVAIIGKCRFLHIFYYSYSFHTARLQVNLKSRRLRSWL